MSPGLIGDTAEEIASADDHCDFHSQIVHIGNLTSDGVDVGGIDAKALVSGQRFTGEFQQDAFEDGSRH